MIDKTYVLTMRETPKSDNAAGSGAHHMQGYREKQKWQGKFLMELMATRVPKAMQFCRVEVTIRWKYKNRRDSTNWFKPVYKPLLDALVRGGYLKDDTDEYVAVSGVKFEYPDDWPHPDPRVKSEMIVKLEASYL